MTFGTNYITILQELTSNADLHLRRPINKKIAQVHVSRLRGTSAQRPAHSCLGFLRGRSTRELGTEFAWLIYLSQVLVEAVMPELQSSARVPAPADLMNITTVKIQHARTLQTARASLASVLDLSYLRLSSRLISDKVKTFQMKHV